MTKLIDEAVLERLNILLPKALDRILDSYIGFSARDFSKQDPDEFSEHHTACKVAMAHLELLMKVAQRAQSFEPDENGDQPDLEEMLTKAIDEVADYHRRAQR